MEYRNAIFIVTEEYSCPLYSVGEEFKIEDMALSTPAAKPGCLVLIRELMKAVSREEAGKSRYERFTSQGVQKIKFECGACAAGRLSFEFKKEKGFSTVQMQLLAAAEQRAKLRHLDKYYGVLRGMSLFESLRDEALRDVFAQMQVKEYAAGQVIIRQGEPGTNLYIVLEGQAAVIGNNGKTIFQLGPGEIFGEMSLLSGQATTTSVQSMSRTRLATLSSKDFKHILTLHPVMQVFFYRMLVERGQSASARSAAAHQEMAGKLSEINTLDVFQMIHATQKTGRVQLLLNDGEAFALFNQGELVYARYGAFSGKEAFFRLLDKGEGSFAYSAGLSQEEESLPAIGAFMSLIMEGIRRIDEQEKPPEKTRSSSAPQQG